ncbi:hypothetical protein F0L68_02225 [Solihabitans fulvus]|uniref:DUF6923 domain-containing protein n=1 Tax=Solihabitans fulvus TaxID=1892852 RepID=A0A5B2XUV0_9PSEU|nr:hypothetical protein [Solihabitans fulvus]KAA2266574.1 hypothetical protein F0L68_02225 [Solihabitans fulvus]
MSYQVRTGSWGTSSTLSRVELATGETSRVADLGYTVTAIGYAADQDTGYGIATSHLGRQFIDGAHVVRFDRRGVVTDLGRPGGTDAPWWGDPYLEHSYGGEVLGGTLYVHVDFLLYAVDVNPASGSYLRVLRRTELRPALLGLSVGDIGRDPASGALYGVSATGYGSARIVRIDPGTGDVSVVSTPAGLPGSPVWPGYGSVVVDAERNLYAVNGADGGSRLYRVRLDGSGGAQAVATGPAVFETDATGCIAAAQPPPTTPPPPPPTTGPPPTVPPPGGTPTNAPGQPNGPPPNGAVPGATTTPPPGAAQPPGPGGTASSVPSGSVAPTARPSQRAFALAPVGPRRPGEPPPSSLTRPRELVIVVVLLIVLGGTAASSSLRAGRARRGR